MIAQLIENRHDVVRLVTKQCAWCWSVKIGGRYVKFPGLGRLSWAWCLPWRHSQRLVLALSHGMCPSCSMKMVSAVKRRSAA